jgi:hypothetical protein
MPNVNDEMKASADNAIRSAKERFGQELDYSEQSIVTLENLLGQIYQTFSNNTREEETTNVISDTAFIWGSYLGEYMCLKWGGTWILNGSDQLVSIHNNEYSPINLVYQKMTGHPEYSLENYLTETKRKIYTSVINQQQSQYLSENIGRPKSQFSITQSKKPVVIEKHILFTLAGIGGILLALVAFIVGFRMIKTGGIPAFGLIASTTSSNTNNPVEKTLVTTTSYSINNRHSTVTPLPTYPTFPTFTTRPSYTPYLTYTQKATLTPTAAKISLILKYTLAPRMSPTSIPNNPTYTPIPPTNLPSPTATKLPSPTPSKVSSPTATQLPSPTATQLPLPTATKLPSPTATNPPPPTATNPPPPTATEQPSPTATELPLPTRTKRPKPTAPGQPSPTATELPPPTATELPPPTATELPPPTATELPPPTTTGSP